MSSKNNLNIIAAAAAMERSSTTSSKLVLPPKLTASISRLQWHGTDYPLDVRRQDVHHHDVLNGRGGASNNHPGNEAFRELVNKVKVDYLQCPKREKPLLAMRIVQAVRAQCPPGRFLQHDKLTDTWKDVGDTKAREKTSQALREGAPIIRDMVHKPSPSTLASVLKEDEPTKKSSSDITVSRVVSTDQGSPPTQGLLPLPAASCLTFPKHFEMEEHRITAHLPVSTLSVDAMMPNFYHQHSVESRRVTGDFCATARNEPSPVPFGIVRGLLLGHIDPVAAGVLSREEAAFVAQRFQFNARQTMMLPMTSPTATIHGGKSMDIAQTRLVIDSTQLARTPSSSSDQSEPKERPVKLTKQPKSQRRTPLKKRKFIDIDV